MEELKAYLETRPDITEVWLNDASQWCFSPNDQFPNKFTREDILGTSATDANSQPAKTKK